MKPTVFFESAHASGNIYFVLGLVYQELVALHREDDFKACQSRVYKEAKSYNDSLSIIREYVDLVDIDGNY